MTRNFIKISALFFLCLGLQGCSLHHERGQMFTSPDEAMLSLENAVVSPSPEKSLTLLGPEGPKILSTGKPEIDQQRRQKFTELFKQAHSFQVTDENVQQLVIGYQKWPFPIPLTKSGDKWFFDVEAGREEILNREIGRNELSAINICRNIPLLQRQYAVMDADGDGKVVYAKRLISTPGSKDGLYWPVLEGEDPSPLGPIIAKAVEENYSISADGQPAAYNGYYFKLLDPVSNTNFTEDSLSRPGRYWLVASPEERGKSGVMTFAVNERGWIYEKDLGADKNFSAETQFDVDASWARIE